MSGLIRLIKPYISYEEVENDIKEVFESGMFTKGKHVQAFADELAEYTGARYVFPVTSATTALWTCLKLLEIKPGDEVLVADFSFPATANVVEDLGAKPVFVDVSLDTYNMSPEDLELKITKKTKAVIFVDALGNPTGITEIKSICEKYDLPLIEDAACAIGSSEHGKRCGSIADLTCFSFHPRKLISTGEGGAITTNRADWADWLTVKLMHGASGIKNGAMDFVDYGYNFRLPELSAIMGRVQLEKLDQIVEDRNTMRAEYISGLESLGFKAQLRGHTVVHNVQSLVFTVPDNMDRNSLVNYLKKQGIEATIGTYCLSGTAYNKKRYNCVQPNAAILEGNTITLPCYEGLDVSNIVNAISEFTYVH